MESELGKKERTEDNKDTTETTRNHNKVGEAYSISSAMPSIHNASYTQTHLIKFSGACSLHCRDPFFHLTTRLCTQHKSPEWGDHLG